MDWALLLTLIGHQQSTLQLDKEIKEMKNQQNKQPLLHSPSRSKVVTSKSSFFSLFKYADRMDKTLMAVGTSAAVGAGVASPLFMIFFSTISEIFIPGNQDQAQAQGRDLFVKLLLVGIFTWVCHAVAMWGWNKSGSRQTIRFKKLYYAALLKQQIAWYDSKQTSKITSQISQNTLAIQAAIGQKISIAVTSLVTSAFGFVFAFVKCWQMSLYLALFLPFMLAAGFLMMKSLTMKAQTSKISYENASGIAETAFGAIKTVKTLVSQAFENKKFSQALAKAQPKLTKHILYSSLSSAFMNLIMMGIYSFGFFIGKQMMIDHPGQYSPSDIISTFFCFMVAGQTVGQISPIFKNVADAKIAAEKIYDLINREQTLAENDEGIKLESIDRVELLNVGFGYNDMKTNNIKTVLNSINLRINKGTITALVGSSGSGKSTIAQLLLHYYSPTNGSIKIDGYTIDELNIYEYRRLIGYVGQEPVLFSMSIKDNIRIANPDITDQEIKQVLEKAYAWDFVQKLENGMDTYVGSRGAQLSGGQKQRIAIARTLAKNPQMIILDEATSALDQSSEREVQKTIANLVKEDIAVVVIAHRLSTIRNADHIVVIDQGNIIQQGSHEELVQINGVYFKLVQKQLQGESSFQKIQGSREQNMQEVLIQPSVPASPQTKQKQKLKVESKAGDSIQVRTRASIYWQLAKHGKDYWHYFAIGSVFALINGLVYPFFNASFSSVMGLMANPQSNNQQINQFCLAFLLIAIVASISNFAYNFLYGLYGEKLVYLLRVKVFKKMLKFSCSYFDLQQNTPGAISIRLSQNSYQLHNVLTGVMSVLCLNLSIIVASLAFALYFSWKLTLIVLLFSPLMAAKGAIAATVLKRITKKSDQIEKNMGSFVSDTIGNIRTVKSFGGYDQFEKMFNQNLDKMEQIVSQKFLKMGILMGFSRSSAVLVYAIVFWVAAALFANNQFNEPTDALVAIFCIVFSATTVGQNSQLMPDLVKAENSANNILNTLETNDEYQIAKQSQDISLKKHKLKGTIQFRNVCFKYPTRQQRILHNFNLIIKQREKVGLVGPSGSGKSTIFHILSRLYPIQSGEVFIDGYSIDSYNLRHLRKQLGLMSQEPTIFKGTIKQNILYRLPDKDQYLKKFNKYTKISCVDEMVENWQQKYDKQVGERGSLVSGGQKQRIALARCLMKNPRILLMDEPTSALDIETESKLFANLQQVITNKTVVFSAHRMCTVKYASKIVVVKAGQIVEEGSYNQLLEKKQQFYSLLYGNKQNEGLSEEQ